MNEKTTDSHHSAPDDVERTYLKEAFAAWGWLGLIFNATLLVEGLACSWYLMPSIKHGVLFLGGYLGFVFFFGIVANVFYCLGPLVEAYAFVLLGHPFHSARTFLWATGLVFSMFVVLLITGRISV